MENMKFARAVKAARKAIAALADVDPSMALSEAMACAYRKCDLVDRAAGCQEEHAVAWEIRKSVSPAIEAAWDARHVLRNAEIKRLDAEINNNKRNSWKNL